MSQERPIRQKAAEMKIHRKLIVLVGIGLLFIMAVTVASIQQVTAVFSRSINDIGRSSVEVQRMWRIETVVLENALRISSIVKKLREIKREDTVEYLGGINMTKLKDE